MEKKTVSKILKITNKLLCLYKLPYACQHIKYLKNSCFYKKNVEKHTLVFCVFRWCSGRILGRICQEISAYFSGKSIFADSSANLPMGEMYFFPHYSFLSEALKENPYLWQSKLFVWYTHPKSEERLKITEEELYYILRRASKVICTCSRHAKLLVLKGLNPNNVTYIIGGGADPEVFLAHQRSNGSVGFCSAYSERKNPELMLSIVKAMSHRKFILLSANNNRYAWTNYKRFNELVSLPNMSYVEVPYSDFPKYYTKMDVFVSTSDLEGGPVPLLEAMMCNIVPVVSDTGFAFDIIRHGENGFLFNADSQVKDICSLIEKAFEIKGNIRKTVEHLTWKKFSLEIQKNFAVNA